MKAETKENLREAAKLAALVTGGLIALVAVLRVASLFGPWLFLPVCGFVVFFGTFWVILEATD